MRDKIFHTVCFGFLFGVLLRSFVFVSFYFTILLSVIALALFLFFTLISNPPERLASSSRARNNWGVLVSVFVLAFSFGIFRFSMADVANPAIFESQVGEKVSLGGEIVDEPSIRENNQQLIVQTVAGEDKTKILLSAGLGENYKYGDEIHFAGTLKKPENFITDTGKEFDYINYLRKDGILYVMSYPKIEIVSEGNGNFIKNALFYVKEKFLEKIDFVVPNPENLLMGGLILGEKSAFSKELRQDFVDTGTIHIIALSGYNITIIAEWFMKLFVGLSFVPKNFGIGMGIFSVFLFIMMTGASSTAIRAGMMATLALIARATGRNYDVARALILAGIGMIMLNPFLLVFDVSFQLSFIATVAVIFFTPRIEKYFLWITESFGLRDIVSVTTAAYIFVFPFVLYKMGNFSLIALPANVLVLPFIPLTMLLGFLTGFAGLVLPVLSIPIGYISYLFLHYELGVIKFFAGLSFASFNFPNFPLFLALIIYGYFIYNLFDGSIKKFFSMEKEDMITL
ncbi:ComEC/Rec2 family competence protein [Candidatus Nomurabacteria bacterium]|nr:ComEC/Rec2 family competence protein [Candidatus Nomurabacteria bacterium]